MTLVISWWAIPLLITIVAFIVANVALSPTSGGDYGAIGDALEFVFFNGVAFIVSLIAWLIYALLT